jgi:hypothetical protein
MINKMLPKGFRFEAYETVKRQLEQAKQASKVPVNKRKRNALDEETKKNYGNINNEDSTGAVKRQKRTSNNNNEDQQQLSDSKRVSQR